MSNFELLKKTHIYINEANFFYSKIADTSKKQKLDEILEIKKRICQISSFHSSSYPLQILLIQHQLKRVLPYKQFPVHNEYSKSLQSILDQCRENLKAKKVTA